jgi:hypothetical protein
MKWKEKGITFSHRDGEKLLPDVVVTRKMLIEKLKEFVDGKIANKELCAWEDYIWAHDPKFNDWEGDSDGLRDSFTNEVLGIIATDGSVFTKKAAKDMVTLLESGEDYEILSAKLYGISFSEKESEGRVTHESTFNNILNSISEKYPQISKKQGGLEGYPDDIDHAFFSVSLFKKGSLKIKKTDDKENIFIIEGELNKKLGDEEIINKLIEVWKKHISFKRLSIYHIKILHSKIIFRGLTLTSHYMTCKIIVKK